MRVLMPAIRVSDRARRASRHCAKPSPLANLAVREVFDHLAEFIGVIEAAVADFAP